MAYLPSSSLRAHGHPGGTPIVDTVLIAANGASRIVAAAAAKRIGASGCEHPGQLPTGGPLGVVDVEGLDG